MHDDDINDGETDSDLSSNSGSEFDSESDSEFNSEFDGDSDSDLNPDDPVDLTDPAHESDNTDSEFDSEFDSDFDDPVTNTAAACPLPLHLPPVPTVHVQLVTESNGASGRDNGTHCRDNDLAAIKRQLDKMLGQLSNYGRFTAEINSRIVETNKKFDGMTKRFDGMTKRFDGMTKRFDGVFKFLKQGDKHRKCMEVEVAHTQNMVVGMRDAFETTAAQVAELRGTLNDMLNERASSGRSAPAAADPDAISDGAAGGRELPSHSVIIPVADGDLEDTDSGPVWMLDPNAVSGILRTIDSSDAASIGGELVRFDTTEQCLSANPAAWATNKQNGPNEATKPTAVRNRPRARSASPTQAMAGPMTVGQPLAKSRSASPTRAMAGPTAVGQTLARSRSLPPPSRSRDHSESQSPARSSVGLAGFTSFNNFNNGRFIESASIDAGSGNTSGAGGSWGVGAGFGTGSGSIYAADV